MRIFIYSILLAVLLYVCTMIDMRGAERIGACTINGYTIQPVSSFDCKGEFSD